MFSKQSTTCLSWLYSSQTHHISDISAQKQGNGKLSPVDSSSPLLAVTHFNLELAHRPANVQKGMVF